MCIEAGACCHWKLAAAYTLLTGGALCPPRVPDAALAPYRSRCVESILAGVPHLPSEPDRRRGRLAGGGVRPGRLWASTSGIVSTGFAALHAFLSAAVPLMVSLLVRALASLRLVNSKHHV